jgi:hypothetical protein
MSRHSNLPFHLYVNINNGFLGPQMPHGVTQGIWHGVYCRPNQILMCHILLESGAHWSGLPIHALSASEDFQYGSNELMPWSAMGEDLDVYHVKYLEGIECDIREPIEEKGRHIGIIIDWKDGFSRHPQEHKPLNAIELRNGQFGLYPNNFLTFKDKHFVNNSSKDLLKFYKRNETTFWGE